MDFAKLVEAFEKHQVTFVSVTQQFNTTTSMGRLTLNILLSFAQVEREVIGERIRDKFAASRRKGRLAPLGYDIASSGVGPPKLVTELAAKGALNKQGKPIDEGYPFRVLNNRMHLGEAVHK